MVARLSLLVVSFILTTTCQAFAQYHQQRSSQFQAASENFVVTAPDQSLAKQVASEAERFRKELAQLWLGYELEPWSEKCPIEVQLAMHAGGETSFAFVGDGRGPAVPTSWRMKIFGPPDRLLDAVLPHEVTHTIFATHFGRPLPRWADEGACTTVEHQSERDKNHRMLIDFLSASPSRGIPFNRMFTMRRYPHDILPLYAQGYSVAKYLIMQKGRRHFLDYLEEGMQLESGGQDPRAWDVATKKHYGFRDLSDLQIAWIGWVKNGSVEQAGGAIALASATEQDSAPERVALAAGTEALTPETHATLDRLTEAPRVAAATGVGGWYARQMKETPGNRVSTNRRSLEQTENASHVQDSRVESGTLWR